MDMMPEKPATFRPEQPAKVIRVLSDDGTLDPRHDPHLSESEVVDIYRWMVTTRQLDERLVAHRTASYGVGYATKGWPRPKRVPRPVWWLMRRPINAVSSSITIGGMPPRGREVLGLPWDDVRERRYQRFAAICRALNGAYQRLPGRYRMHPIPLRAFQREGRRA